MLFKNLIIKNFRNLESVDVEIQNQNVVFGMNDMGKTNLLTALRFLFEREVRNNGFAESDYYDNDIEKEILIQVELNLSNLDCDDTNMFIANVGGARNSDESNSFYIQLSSKFDGSEYYGVPVLKWGSDLNDLIDIPQKGSFSDLDKIFKVVYIDPSIDLMTIFNKNRRIFFDEMKLSEKDQDKKEEIQCISKTLNKKISSMEVIKNFQNILTEEYQKFREEDISVEMKSEVEIKGYFNDLMPYIKRGTNGKNYPTSDDGRKKLLSYSLINYVARMREKNKIVLFLIEEPENKLHRTMQIALSKQLFTDSIYEYFFLSTHSEEMLYEMDETTLIRVHSQDGSTCNSHVFKVPLEYKKHKKELNRSLATGLFADKVLLIEGPSEQILFEKVLSEMNPHYEINGNYILNVNGVKFREYYEILKNLKIKVLVKTDNDLQGSGSPLNVFYVTGINRGCTLIGEKKIDHVSIDYEKDTRAQKIKEKKELVYRDNYEKIKLLEESGIYISKIDLEHDLSDALGEKLNEVLNEDDGINFLQKRKQINMGKLAISLTREMCEDIYNNNLFKVLRELK